MTQGPSDATSAPAVGSGALSDQPAECGAESNGLPTNVEGVRTASEQSSAAVPVLDARFLPSSVVHELRTPLTAIHGYAQLLRRGGSLNGVTERAVDTILRETTRLAAQLKQLSEIAELQSGRFASSASAADVGQLTRAAAELAMQQSDAPKVVVEGEAEVRARCDSHRLTQVLSHVLSNAVAYTPPDGKVRILIEREEGGVHLSIEDGGIGIDEEETERIYEPYYRGARALRSGVRGLGVGLYVARQVARRCGGELRHEPIENGTRFHLTWPDAEPRQTATAATARS